MPARPEIYAPFTLTADLAGLSANERKMLGLFVDAAEVMDDLFWRQAYGDRDKLLDGLKQDPKLQQFARINYGPWDRLAGNAPFIAGVGAKPAGAQFYPLDMSKEEFEKANLPGSRSEYTVLRRDAQGRARSRAVPHRIRRRRAEGSRAASSRPPGSPRIPGSSATSTPAPLRCGPTSTATATARGWR